MRIDSSTANRSTFFSAMMQRFRIIFFRLEFTNNLLSPAMLAKPSLFHYVTFAYQTRGRSSLGAVTFLNQQLRGCRTGSEGRTTAGTSRTACPTGHTSFESAARSRQGQLSESSTHLGIFCLRLLSSEHVGLAPRVGLT